MTAKSTLFILLTILFCLHVRSQDLQPSPLFIKVEHDAVYPGGNKAWTDTLTKLFNDNKDAIEKDPASSESECEIQLIVHKDGTVSDVEVLKTAGAALDTLLVDFIRNGPRWNPALQNGREVNAFRRIKVVYPRIFPQGAALFDDAYLAYKVNQDATYPGGDTAWKSALSALFADNKEALEKDGDHSRGECQLRFLVHTDGSVSDVTALNMTDSKLAGVLIRFIKKGPRWTPPVRGGKAVGAYHSLKVTYPE